MAGPLTTLRWGNAASLLLVLCWNACTSQTEHLAFQSSCDPANFSTAKAMCLDQGMQLYSINDLAKGGDLGAEALKDHTSIWIFGKGKCVIHTLSNFTDVNCSKQHHYICKRNASVEELPKNGTVTGPIYVPCKATSVSPLSSSTVLSSTTTNTSTTTSSPLSSGISNKAIYLIVAVCVCVIVVCVVAAVVIKRCTAKKEENVSLKNVDVIRERDEGVALTENKGNKDDTRM